ncbi:MAG TPA: hypothetical protein DHV62_09345 [Elusimicrobia bacterium]|jgi:hypothetical protein|nr:hypothetical protein [Elusimicrobiota bacterium]
MRNSRFRNFLFWFLIFTINCGLSTINCLYATPSTHIWAPATDIQPYKKFHLTADFYVPVKENDNGSWAAPVTNFGFTLGVLPYEKIQAEVGFDHIAGYGSADSYPFYFNAKIGTPEDSLKKGVPAFVFGTYALGTKKDITDYNIFYYKFAKTLPKIGKFSAGYYSGNEKLLLDTDGKADNGGILIAWEKVVSEISDKLWVCVDYQGGKNSFGALNLGFSWAFSSNTSVIFAYDIYNNSSIKPTYTTQVDINF